MSTVQLTPSDPSAAITTTAPPPVRLTWDVMCRVVDNLGDLGVCWRLARRLAALGQQVRLWVDDASALAWMAPDAAATVALRPWRALRPDEQPGDVVVETFGGDLPAHWLARMAACAKPPVWIDVEYLSAEPYVARSHGLPSPQSQGPGAGLTRWFFYPGFTPSTGGLLLDEDDGPTPLDTAHDKAASAQGLWHILGLADLARAPQVPTVSLFCYEQPALSAWLAHWQQSPTRLLVTPGLAAQQVAARLGGGTAPGTVLQCEDLTVHFLPWLTQPDYDRLLRACDLNHVRGEDSLVRALWAARPFVWQAYRQDDEVHQLKLRAFTDWYVHGADPSLATALHHRFANWNLPLAATPVDTATPPLATTPPPWPADQAWPTHARNRSAALRAQTLSGGDLGLQLYRFALAKR